MKVPYLLKRITPTNCSNLPRYDAAAGASASTSAAVS
jgi:hypothetical protein